ncbi:MAG TPA: phospho-N-acetylmuramoyl-pentapeptide-transferase [Oscillospiraceae bacterium]|nr:phospho-N-acetylmuramoyl-pentapeptide-transferase [Oscillospiraceae bacterium]
MWTLTATVLSFTITAVLGKWLIPFLHKLNFGQTIRDEGPQWHKKKQGTPTMGGIMFIIGIVVAILICVPLYYATSGSNYLQVGETPLMKVKIFGGLIMAIAFGAIGFFDDYIKVVKKRNLGLTARQKLFLQFLVAASYLASIYLTGGASASVTMIPFVGSINLGIGYWIIALLGIVGIVNAVNLTDGIDGLNASVTFFVGVFFMMIAGLMGMFGLSIVAISLAGGCLGFLVWNFNPAKVFMGDTGSLFLGGMVCAIGFGLNLPILILLVGFVYVMEILSDVLQVLYFKATHGKRIFKMAPIHHHFEMCGWSEVKICFVFSLICVVTGVASVLLVIYGI